MATMIGTAAGFLAWGLDLTKTVWPAHPQLAGIVLTIVTTIAVQLMCPTDKPQT